LTLFRKGFSFGELTNIKYQYFIARKLLLMKTFDVQNRRLQAKIVYENDTPVASKPTPISRPNRTIISIDSIATSRKGFAVDGVVKPAHHNTNYSQKRLENQNHDALALTSQNHQFDQDTLNLPLIQDLTPQFVKVSDAHNKPTLQEAYKSLSSHPYIQTQQLHVGPSRLAQFRKYLGLVTASFGVVIMLSTGIVALGSKMTNSSFNFSNFTAAKDQTMRNLEVAGVSEDRTVDMQKELYREWILATNNGVYSDPDADIDSDGLTNDEERKLGTNPTNPNTCGGEKNDSEKLFYLVNPVNCTPINFEKPEEVALFNQVINVDKVKKEFVANLNTQPAIQPASDVFDEKNLLGLFGVATFNDIDKINLNAVKDEAQSVSKKAELKSKYLSTISKIDKYISQNRSYEPFDRNYLPPAHPAKYLETSLKYNVPLKYVLAVAQAESRFGTDRYTLNGNPTRIGKNLNVYSIGLTDSPNIADTSFPTWEDGIEAFGKWYKRFNDSGVSDCRKWKIFNPNGDYCAKITDMSNIAEAAVR
jgi:membrane-bound lytic murein transglycosylase B